MKINIQESLKERDAITENRYNLYNTYTANNYTVEQKKKITEAIYKGATDTELLEMLDDSEVEYREVQEYAKANSNRRFMDEDGNIFSIWDLLNDFIDWELDYKVEEEPNKSVKQLFIDYIRNSTDKNGTLEEIRDNLEESSSSEYDTLRKNYERAKSDFEKYGETDNNDVLSREEKMLIAKAEMNKAARNEAIKTFSAKANKLDESSLVDKKMNTLGKAGKPIYLTSYQLKDAKAKYFDYDFEETDIGMSLPSGQKAYIAKKKVTEDIGDSSEIGANKMTIVPLAGLNADGFTVVINNADGEELFKKEYSYGYNASYDRKLAQWAEKDYNDSIKYGWKTPRALKPYVADIIDELCRKYGIDKNSIEFVPGKNVFNGGNVTGDFVDSMKKKVYESKQVKVFGAKRNKLTEESAFTESSYGGAFDAEDDQYFTKEDLMEFAEEIMYVLHTNAKGPLATPDYTDLYVDGNQIFITVIDEDGNEFTDKVSVDFRRIRRLSDLISKYTLPLAERIMAQAEDFYRDMNEGCSKKKKKLIKEDVDKNYAFYLNLIDTDVEDMLKEYHEAGNKSPSEILIERGYTDTDSEIMYKEVKDDNHTYRLVIDFEPVWEDNTIHYYVLKDGKIPAGYTYTKISMDIEEVEEDLGELSEGYELLNGTKVEVYSDYNAAKARADGLGLKEAEYGDIYGSNYSYCYWNESGDRNDDEQIIAYYKFENGKPRPLTSEERDIVKRKYEISSFDDFSMENESCELNKKSNKMKSKLTESALDINQGDLVDFGPYGKLYVCNPNYHDDYYWVTDEEESRMDKYASGWSIAKDLAERVIESAFDEEDLEEDLGGVIPYHYESDGTLVAGYDPKTGASVVPHDWCDDWDEWE